MAAKRPTKVHVGPFTYVVKWSVSDWADALDAASSNHDQEVQRCLGLTDKRGCVIYINPLADPQYQKEALLHEIMHACQFTAGLPDEGMVKGHDFITRSAPMLLDALMRSPGLSEYLSEK
jgi:hypothetical protein